MVCESTVLLSHCQLLSPSSWVTFSESVLYAEWCSPCDPLPPYQSIGIWTEKLLQIASVSLFSCCCCLVAKSCPNLLWPQGLQTTRILCLWEFPRQEYFSGLSLPSPGVSWPRDQTCISYIGRYILYHWVTWEVSFRGTSNWDTELQSLSAGA